jgi:hypothetical protein
MIFSVYVVPGGTQRNWPARNPGLEREASSVPPSKRN